MSARAFWVTIGVGCVLMLGVSQGQGKPPTKISVIEDVYPDLHSRALRENPVSWARLRKMAAARWRATHPAWVRAERVRHLVANPTPTGNRELASLVLSPDDFACMDAIVASESSWVHTVYNRAGSGAYGIPQALPGHKMASAGHDWAHNPLTQIRWMKGYAEGRYGSLCSALSFRRAAGWY